VKELTPRPAGIAAEPLVAALDEDAADAEVAAGADAADEEDEVDDEQPAATTAATAARATQLSRGRGLHVLWPASRRRYRCIAIATPPLG
jgi:hypothetical protein